MSKKIVKFPGKDSPRRQETERTLEYMIQQPEVSIVIARIIGGFGVGYEFEYVGPRSTVHTENGYVDLRYGKCDAISIDGDNKLIVHDSFPFALERIGVNGNASWYVAALFAGLKEAIHVRAVWPGSDFSRVLQHVQTSALEGKLWLPRGDTNIRGITLNRVAATLALDEMGIQPGMLHSDLEPPYPNHIAAFIDPVYLGEISST